MEYTVKLTISASRFYDFLIQSLQQDIQNEGVSLPSSLAGFRYKKASGTKVHVGNLKQNLYYKVTFSNAGHQTKVEYRLEEKDGHCLVHYISDENLSWRMKHNIKKMLKNAQKQLVDTNK